MSKFEEITGFKFNPRQVKLGFYSFGVIFVISLFTLKPYLATALYRNWVDIDDYRIFPNRTVQASTHPLPWEKASSPYPAPGEKLQSRLNELDTTALVLVDDGKLAYESYALSGGENEWSGSFSMAKSIVSILIGFAIQDGAIPRIDSEIRTWLPEWADRPEASITLRHLLSMSSGLNWKESQWNPFSITTEAYYGSTLITTTLKQRLILEPGTQFSYQSGSSQLLGMVLTRAVNKTLAQYASEKLWQPLGAEKNALWSTDRPDVAGQGSLLPPMEKAFCCFNAKATDFARIGQLVLNGGSWQGKSLLNPEYIREMTTPKKVDYYGYQWWILPTSHGPIPYARGVLGQYLMVIPQKNRVIVRLGMKMGKKLNHHPEEVWELAEWAFSH